MRRFALGAVGLAAAFSCAVASADGGEDIARAPEIPLRQQQQGGDTDYRKSEYWRITMARADRLRLDFGSTNGGEVELCLLSPTVTDFTLNQSSCLSYEGRGSTVTKDQMRFVAPTPGRYTLQISGDCCSAGYAYIITAYVRHFTHTSVRAPRLVSKGRKFTVAGQVAGATGGSIELRMTTKGQKPRTGVLALSKTGSFSLTRSLPVVATYKIRAIYYGDDSHLPSSASTTVRVA